MKDPLDPKFPRRPSDKPTPSLKSKRVTSAPKKVMKAGTSAVRQTKAEATYLAGHRGMQFTGSDRVDTTQVEDRRFK